VADGVAADQVVVEGAAQVWQAVIDRHHPGRGPAPAEEGSELVSASPPLDDMPDIDPLAAGDACVLHGRELAVG